jgi:magnesium transporter
MPEQTFSTNAIDNSMVMKCVAYQNGVTIGDVTLETISEVLQQDHSFLWLGLREADCDLLQRIQHKFELHDLAIEDACAAHQRPKIERYGDSLFIVLHTLKKSDRCSHRPLFLFKSDMPIISQAHR